MIQQRLRSIIAVLVRQPVWNHQSTPTIQFLRCRDIHVCAFVNGKITFNLRWRRDCNYSSKLLEATPLSVQSPITELSGSSNTTYMSSVVGTRYNLKCPEGQVQTPTTAQYLTCLPTRKFLLDHIEDIKCTGRKNIFQFCPNYLINKKAAPCEDAPWTQNLSRRRRQSENAATTDPAPLAVPDPDSTLGPDATTIIALVSTPASGPVSTLAPDATTAPAQAPGPASAPVDVPDPDSTVVPEATTVLALVSTPAQGPVSTLAPDATTAPAQAPASGPTTDVVPGPVTAAADEGYPSCNWETATDSSKAYATAFDCTCPSGTAFEGHGSNVLQNICLGQESWNFTMLNPPPLCKGNIDT